jgi:cytoskeletal protein RodZ
MSAPTLDRNTGSPGSSAGHRRRRKQLVVVASALVVLALAVGVSLAIATRPVARQVAADPGAVPAAAGDQNANVDQGQPAEQEQGGSGTPAKPESSSQEPGTAAAAPVLPDGDTAAYITKVDRAGNRIVVDVVQVFHDDQAVKAAIADGKSPSDAKYYTTWVRNENPRLRTLPLAGNLTVKLRDACGEPGTSREALLTRLAANASQKGTYYYTLTVADGQVQRIQERLAVNAC